MTEKPIITQPVAEATANRMRNRLLVEELELQQEIAELEKQLKSKKELLYQNHCEQHIIDNYSRAESSYVEITNTTTTTVRINKDDNLEGVGFKEQYDGRYPEVQRFTSSKKESCNNAIRQIFEQYGEEEIKLSVLISELENMGYVWSRYISAAGYIKKLDMLHQPRRGYYSLARI